MARWLGQCSPKRKVVIRILWCPKVSVQLRWQKSLCFYTQTTDTQWMHKSKKSENLGQCGRQNILPLYLKIWDWDLIFGRAVKAISSPGVRSPCALASKCQFHLIKQLKNGHSKFKTLPFWIQWRYYNQIWITSTSCHKNQILKSWLEWQPSLPHSCPL